MQNQTSSLSTRGSPFDEKFLIKRIGEEDIEIGNPERMAILKALDAGVKYVQVGKYTLMINAIKSIDPKWGWDNIPERPKPVYPYDTRIYISPSGERLDDDHKIVEPLNKDLLDEWDRLFANKEAKEIRKQIGSHVVKVIGGDF